MVAIAVNKIVITIIDENSGIVGVGLALEVGEGEGERYELGVA